DTMIGRPKQLRRPRLTIRRILAWADSEHRFRGRWPRKTDGPVLRHPDETWEGIDSALRSGHRGLPGGSSLPKLLFERRGVRNSRGLSPLTEEQIVTWARVHLAVTGTWPSNGSGTVLAAPGENWENIDSALRCAGRGLPGGDTLARLLARRLGVRNLTNLPDLAVEQILVWADAHRRRTGDWPRAASGPIPEAPGETWQNVESALREGARGLEGGSSLARLLQQHRGLRNPKNLPPLSEKQIVAWAKAHRDRTGRRPSAQSGPILEAPCG